jgi:hypothetical protein
MSDLTTQQIEDNLAMEFEAEMAEIPDRGEDDHELLQLQKRKSTPKVVIEEFVAASSDDEEECTSCPAGRAGRPHKVKTHYEIDDVSTHHFSFLANSSAALTRTSSSSMACTRCPLSTGLAASPHPPPMAWARSEIEAMLMTLYNIKTFRKELLKSLIS